jgi:hypothetical protein
VLNSKVDHPDYQADHTDWGVQVCDAVGSPRVKLLYNIYHMQIMEGDIIRTIRPVHDKIGLFHSAGNPGRNDLDDAQELNYPAILSAIKETGYTGYIAHEFIPKGDPALSLQTVFQECAAVLGPPDSDNAAEPGVWIGAPVRIIHLGKNSMGWGAPALAIAKLESRSSNLEYRVTNWSAR